jgi:hypothetical protein
LVVLIPTCEKLRLETNKKAKKMEKEYIFDFIFINLII